MWHGKIRKWFLPAGEVFDEEIPCSFAICQYIRSGDATSCGQALSENSNGNDSLVRILPVCVYLKDARDEGLEDRCLRSNGA